MRNGGRIAEGPAGEASINPQDANPGSLSRPEVRQAGENQANAGTEENAQVRLDPAEGEARNEVDPEGGEPGTRTPTREGAASSDSEVVAAQSADTEAGTTETQSTGSGEETAESSADGVAAQKASGAPGSGQPQSAAGTAGQVSPTESPGAGKKATPARGEHSQKRDGEAESQGVQGRASADGPNAGRRGAAPPTTTQGALGGKAAESASGSRVTTDGGEQTDGNRASSGTSGEQRFDFESNEGNPNAAPPITKEGEAGQFSVRGNASAIAGQEPSGFGASGPGSQDVSASAPRSEGAPSGSSTAPNGSAHGNESMAQSQTSARGAPPSQQPAADAGRPAGSPTARLEQALNAEFERGFVGRLRDNGEMRLTVHRSGLGEIELRVTVRDSGVHASIATQHDEARQLLSSQRADLETALQRYNLRLDSFSVEVGARGDGRSSLRHDSEQGWPNGGGDPSVVASGTGEQVATARAQGHDTSDTGLSVRV